MLRNSFLFFVTVALLHLAPSRLWAAPAESPFGINGASWSHLGANTEAFDWVAGIRRLDSLQQMGAVWDRCDFWWHRIEPQKGTFVWRDYDRVVDEYRRRRLHLMPILAYDAAWRPEQSPETDEYREEYGRFVYETVRHFNGRVRAYEIWNEPNITIFWRRNPSPETYAKLLAVAHREARRADPGVTVVGGAIAGMDFAFIEGMLKAGAGKHMDVLSVHPYQGNLGSVGPEAGRLAEDIGRLRQMLTRYGYAKMPIWITEMGHRTVPDPSVPKGGAQPSGRVTEQQQANYLVHSHALALSAGVEKVFWFNLQDWPEETWGTIGPDFRKKPSWYAYRAMASTLSGQRQDRQMAAINGVHLPVFSDRHRATAVDGENFTTVMWTETPGTALGLAGFSPNAEVRYARYGGKTATGANGLLNAAGLSTSVALNGEPVYLTSTGNSFKLAPGRAPVAVTAVPATVTPGDRFQLTVRYERPDNRAALARNARAVVLYGQDSRKSLKEYLEPAGKDSYRVRATLPPGQYNVGYVWVGPAKSGVAPARFEATTRLTVRPALAVSVAPDPAQGRNLRLTITNNSTRSLTTTATVDMIGNRTDTVSSIVLEKGQSLTLPISNAQLVDRPLTAPLPVAVTVASGPLRASWSGNVYFWTAGKTWGAPLVLDSAQQWQSQDGTWTGPEDLSATIRARYDENNLYIRAEVTDDTFTQAYALGEIWRGDSFQIAVDPDWSRRPDTTAATEFGLALTPDGPQVYRWTGAHGPVSGADLKVTRDGARSMYEAAIPWRALGVTSVRPGRTLGFSLILNDNDGEDRQGWLMYGDGIATAKRADRYATLTLLPSPAALSPATPSEAAPSPAAP